MSRVDRINGVTGSVAVKAPVKVATTENITLSGTQTIGGVSLTADATPRQRVLVKDQTDATENGIYDVNSGAWTRSPDFDGSRDVVAGTQVLISTGAARVYHLSATDPVTIGTDSLVFTVFTASSIYLEPDADATDQGDDTVDGGQNTINYYVDSLAGSTGVIRLLAGTYTLSTSETIPANVTLKIEPGAIIDGVGTLTINGVFEGYDETFGENLTVVVGSDSHIKGVTFDGNDTRSAAISIATVDNTTFENCTFKDGTAHGFYGTGLTDVNLINCKATGNGDGDFTDGGIYVQGQRITIDGCKSYDNNGTGFIVQSSKAAMSEDITFTDNKAVSNECHGFLTETLARTDLDTSLTVDGRSKRVKFIGNTAISNGRVNPSPSYDQGQCSGFTGHYSRDSIWSGNTAYGNYEHGFVLMDGVDNVWVGNNANYNGMAGFRIQGHTGVAEDTHTGERRTLMISNAANKNGQDSTLAAFPGVLSALWIQANVQDLVCRNNVLQDSVGYGVSISLSSGFTGSYNLFFDGNIITGNDAGDYLLNYDEDRIYGQFFGNDANGALRERTIQMRVDKDDDFTVPSTISKRHYTNSGSTKDITATLPNIQADSGVLIYDQEITFTNSTSGYIFTVTPDASDKLISLTHTIGDSVVLRNQGDSITLKSLGGAGWYVIAQTFGHTMNQMSEFTRSSAYTMTEWRSGQTVFCNNSGAIILTLPTLSGQIVEYTFVQGTSNTITLTPDAGARILGLCDANGDSIQSGAIGSSVTLRSTLSGDWIVRAIHLTWTDIN